MPENASFLDERRFEQLLGNFLRLGVILAAAVVLTGGILYSLQHRQEHPNWEQFRGQPKTLRSPAEIVANALKGESRDIIQLGILLLIATPVTRVILSVLGFILQKDWFYVSTTLVVLVVLLYSLFFGRAG